MTFNVLSPSGAALPYTAVERRARDAGIAVRCGCFCNPGAAERAFGFDDQRMRICLRAIDDAGEEFSVERLADCLGDGTAVGGVRASFGIANTADDIGRALVLLESFAR